MNNVEEVAKGKTPLAFLLKRRAVNKANFPSLFHVATLSIMWQFINVTTHADVVIKKKIIPNLMTGTWK